MNAAQLEAVLQGLRANGGSHKVTKFSSAEGSEWRTWRMNFEQAVHINGWGPERTQREAKAAMEGTAAEFVSDIPAIAAAGVNRDLNAMLNLFEARFLPAAAGQLAAAQFQTAEQLPGEQIATWHSRLRTIFERAYPGQDVQGSRQLITKFTLKLSDQDIRTWTHRANPQTFDAAMTAASNEAASKTILAHEAGDRKSIGSIAAMRPNNPTGAGCFGCNGNHLVRDCPIAANRDRPRSFFRGQSRGGRSGGDSRNGQRGRGRGGMRRFGGKRPQRQAGKKPYHDNRRVSNLDVDDHREDDGDDSPAVSYMSHPDTELDQENY